MNIIELFEIMKDIQIKLEKYIENDENIEENFDNFRKLIQDVDIFKDREKFKLVLQLLSNIIKNHYRTTNFLKKTQKVLIFMKEEIKQTFSNSEIFNFFKSSKIIILFLIDENLITIDQFIADTITNDKFKLRKYSEFFHNEIQPFIVTDTIEINISDDYEKNRRNGENETHICKLIRDDLIDEFITYVNKNDFYLDSTIEISIFETNSLLLKKNPTLIEYAAFYGSISVFKYLFLNNAKIDQTSIWIYSIHGNNPELISFLEDNKISPKDETYQICLKESIKCHHNDLSNYILNNFIKDENLNKFKANKFSYAFHYHNFLYLPNDLNYNFIFFYACQYDYMNVVEYFLNNKHININESIILILFI